MLVIVNVEVTPLPGIGVRQDFHTRAGRRIGVITYRDGHSELLVYRLDDPDACSASLPLTAEEAGTLATLLGAPHLVEQIAAQHRDLTGIETHQIAVGPGSHFDGATLGDTALRSRTGASIVAVIRGGVVHPSPRPDFPLVGGDLLVVVGTDEGLAEAARLLEQG
jgi:TrkA domain protein